MCQRDVFSVFRDIVAAKGGGAGLKTHNVFALTRHIPDQKIRKIFALVGDICAYLAVFNSRRGDIALVVDVDALFADAVSGGRIVENSSGTPTILEFSQTSG